MGKTNFRDNGPTADSLMRPQGGRTIKKNFLIVCEGECTEPFYFMNFRINGKVKVKGIGANTLSLVQYTINLKEEEEYKDYEEVWCVFDRDSFKAQTFNSALELAERNNIKVAYTNEAFELWYLLHFDFHTSALSRHQYSSKLTRKLGRKYEKNDRKIFAELYDYQQTAIKNARNLIKSYTNHNPEKDNPSTTVHLLVEELNFNALP